MHNKKLNYKIIDMTYDEFKVLNLKIVFNLIC